jgi:hypothetical protein
MLRQRRSWLLAAFCIPLWAAAPLHAQDPAQGSAATDAAVDQARQLFNEGLDFVEHEDWAQAEDRFRRVLALRSSHVVSYNLASALMHLGRLVESSELLRAIVRDASADATSHEAAKQLLSELEALIGSLTIRISGDTTGAGLTLDDKPIELSGSVLTLSVDPGEHHVTLRRDGGMLDTKTVQIGGSGALQAELVFELPPRVAPEAAAQALAAKQRSPAGTVAAETARPTGTESDRGGTLLSRWWFWTGVAVVVAGGVVTALLASSPGKASPVSGDTDPPVIHGVVQAGAR